jgi:micrococcal nuclease
VVLVVVALVSCTADVEPLSPGASGRVVAIVDGDTLDIDLGGRVERVRLIGIDTPETKKPGTAIECFGPEATRELTRLLPPGSEVVVRRDVEARDDYGRLLLYVFRFSDEMFVNAELLERGFARTLEIPPNTSFSRALRALSARSESAKIGLWNACNVTP